MPETDTLAAPAQTPTPTPTPTRDLQILQTEYNARAFPGRAATQTALALAYSRGSNVIPDASHEIKHLYGMVRAKSYLALLDSTSVPHNQFAPDRDLLPPTHPFSTRAPVQLRTPTPAYQRALVAAIVMDSLGRPWNSLLHPRDRHGKFIPTFGSVRLFRRSPTTGSRNDQHYATGTYMGANPDGSVNVRLNAVNDPSEKGTLGHIKTFPADQVESFGGGGGATAPGEPGRVADRVEKAHIGDIATSAGTETQEYRNVAARNAFNEGIRDLGDVQKADLTTSNGDTYHVGDTINADVGTAPSGGDQTTTRTGTILDMVHTSDGRDSALVRFDNRVDTPTPAGDRTPEISLLDLGSKEVHPGAPETKANLTPQQPSLPPLRRYGTMSVPETPIDWGDYGKPDYTHDGGPKLPQEIQYPSDLFDRGAEEWLHDPRNPNRIGARPHVPNQMYRSVSDKSVSAKRTPTPQEAWVSGTTDQAGANRPAAPSRQGMKHVGDREIRTASGESAGVGSVVVFNAPSGSGRRSNTYAPGVIGVITNINENANKGYGGARVIVWDPTATNPDPSVSEPGAWRFLSMTHLSGNRFDLVKEADPSLLNTLGKGIDIGGGQSLMPQHKRIARTLTGPQIQAGDVIPIDQRSAADVNGAVLKKGDHVVGRTAAGQLVHGHIQNIRPGQTLLDVTPYGGGEAITISANRTRFMRKASGPYGTADRDDVFYEDAADFNMPVYDHASLDEALAEAGATDAERAQFHGASTEDIADGLVSSDTRQRISALAAHYNSLDLNDPERHSPEARTARMLDHVFRGAMAGRLLESDGGDVQARPPHGQTRAEGDLSVMEATFPQSFGDFYSDDALNEYLLPNERVINAMAVDLPPGEAADLAHNAVEGTANQASRIPTDDPHRMTVEMQTIAAWIKAENHPRGPQIQANAAIQAAVAAVAKANQPHRTDEEKADLLARASDNLRAIGDRPGAQGLKPTLDAIADKVDQYAQENGYDRGLRPNAPSAPGTDFTPPPPPTPQAPTPAPTPNVPEAPPAPNVPEAPLAPEPFSESNRKYGPDAGNPVNINNQDIKMVDGATAYSGTENPNPDGGDLVYVKNPNGSWNTWSSGEGRHWAADSPNARLWQERVDKGDITDVTPGRTPTAEPVPTPEAPTPEPTPTPPTPAPTSTPDFITVGDDGKITITDPDVAFDIGEALTTRIDGERGGGGALSRDNVLTLTDSARAADSIDRFTDQAEQDLNDRRIPKSDPERDHIANLRAASDFVRNQPGSDATTATPNNAETFTPTEPGSGPSPSLPTSSADDAWEQAFLDEVAKTDVPLDPGNLNIPEANSATGTPNVDDMVKALGSGNQRDTFNLLDTWYSQVGITETTKLFHDAHATYSTSRGLIDPNDPWGGRWDTERDLDAWKADFGGRKMLRDGFDMPTDADVMASTATVYSGLNDTKSGHVRNLEGTFVGADPALTNKSDTERNESRAQAAMALAQLTEHMLNGHPQQNAYAAWYRDQAVRLRGGEDIELRTRPRIEGMDDPKFKSVKDPNGGPDYWKTADGNAIFQVNRWGTTIFRPATPAEVLASKGVNGKDLTMFDNQHFLEIGRIDLANTAANRRTLYNRHFIPNAEVLTPTKRRVEWFDMGVFQGQNKYAPGRANWVENTDVATYDENRQTRALAMTLDKSDKRKRVADKNFMEYMEANGLDTRGILYPTARVFQNGHINIELGPDAVRAWGNDFDAKLALLSDHIESLMTHRGGAVWDRPVFVRISNDVFRNEKPGVMAFAIRGNHVVAVKATFDFHSHHGENGPNSSTAHQIVPSGDTWFVPETAGQNAMTATLTHEWGHMIDNTDQTMSGMTQETAEKINNNPGQYAHYSPQALTASMDGRARINDQGEIEWFDNNQIFRWSRSLLGGEYGGKANAELIAESFLQYHSSNGQTANPVAQFFHGDDAHRIEAFDQIMGEGGLSGKMDSSMNAEISRLMRQGMTRAQARYAAYRRKYSINNRDVVSHSGSYNYLNESASTADFLQRWYGIRGMENMTPQEIQNYLAAITPGAAVAYAGSVTPPAAAAPGVPQVPGAPAAPAGGIAP